MKKIIFLCVLCLLVGGLYIARVEIIQKITPVIALNYGVQIDAIQVDRINLNTIAIRYLAASYQDETTNTSITVNDVAIEFDISTNAQNKISSIVIDELVVDVHVSSKDAKRTNKKSSPATVKDYINYLSLYGVDIRRLEVNYFEDKQLLSRFEGQIEHAQGLRLDGLVNYRDYSGNIDLMVDDIGIKGVLTHIDSAKQVMELNGEYEIDDDWLILKVKSNYDLSGIHQYIDDAENILIHGSRGNITATVELDTLRTLDDLLTTLAADIDIDSTVHFSSNYYDVSDASADVRARCVIANQGIEKCTLNQLQRLTVKLNSTPQLLEEYFETPVHTYHFELNPNNALVIKRLSDMPDKLTAEGSVKLFVYTDSEKFRFDAQISNIDLQWGANGWLLLSDYYLLADVRRLAYPFNIQRMKLDAQGNMAVDSKQVRAQITNGTRLALFDVQYDDMLLDVLELQQEDNANITYSFHDQAIYGGKQKISLMMSGAEYSDAMFNIEAVKLNMGRYLFAPNKKSVSAELSMGKILGEKKDIKIKGSELLASIDLNNDNLKIDGDMLLGIKQTPVKFIVSNNIVSGIGAMQFESHSISLSNNEVVTQLIGVTGFPLQLNQGGFALNGAIDWSNDYQDTRISIDVSAKQVGGDYAQNPFENLNVDMKFEENNGWVLSAPATLTIESVNVGVPMSDVSMQIMEYQYGLQEQPVVKVVDFYAAALEGSIFSEVIDIDLNKPVNKFTLYLSSLSLEKLVELNQTQDLLATGIINGELPMTLNEGVLEIDNGWMNADENGGFIKYARIGEVLSGNEDLKLVAQLLEDFQYHEMSAQVNLNPGY